MSKDYCQEIADAIAMYRYSERKNGTLDVIFDKAHVERWVSQFDDCHDIILQETANLVNTYYFTEENVEAYLQALYSSSKVWGADVKQAIANTQFLNCQSKGHSQDWLFNQSRRIILETYHIDIAAPRSGITTFAYVDDCMFSGSTVRKDLEKRIEQVPNGSIIHAVFMHIHSFAAWWVIKSLEETLERKGVRLNIWNRKNIQNSAGKNHSYECLWPREYKSTMVDNYLQSLRKEMEATPDKKVRLFRDECYTGGIYTSENNRAILEQQLMEAGLKIIGFSGNNKPFIRPMGYDNRISFGFGAFFATYMNMSNNCPLAFWWGGANAEPWHPFSKWYPLLPRKANENGGDMIAWERAN